jgi:hypothetical protein
MPWERDAVSIDGSGDGNLSVQADGVDLRLHAAADEVSSEIPPEVAAATVGWFQGRLGVMRFDVAYDDHDRQCAGARDARVDPFVALGLVAAGQPAHTAFTRPSAPIEIHLPPRPVG